MNIEVETYVDHYIQLCFEYSLPDSLNGFQSILFINHSLHFTQLCSTLFYYYFYFYQVLSKLTTHQDGSAGVKETIKSLECQNNSIAMEYKQGIVTRFEVQIQFFAYCNYQRRCLPCQILVLWVSFELLLSNIKQFHRNIKIFYLFLNLVIYLILMLRSLNIGNRVLRSALESNQKRVKYQIISTKFTYGQGGFCQLDLKNRNYTVSLITIWEDFCEIQVKGLSAEQQKDFITIQNQGKALISDYKFGPISEKQTQHIKISLKVPQDYTFQGVLNGNMQQIKTPMSNKLRSESFILELIGKNRFLKLNQVQTPRMQIKGQPNSCKIQISKITVESGQLQCFNFVSDKLMISSSFKAIVKNHIFLKSLIMYGNAKSQFDCGRVFQADSVSGMTKIDAKAVDVKRFYKSLSTKQESFSQIDTDQIRTCNVQSGNFDICYSKGYLGKPSTGKTFNGKVEQRDIDQGKTLCKIRE